MLIVSAHAIDRAMQRLPGVRTEGEAIAALDTPAVRRAVQFGAKYVRLGTGQRIVLEDGIVTTVLPRDTHPWKMGSHWDRIRQHARGWARLASYGCMDSATPAKATEAQRAETGTGSVHDGAVAQPFAQPITPGESA